MVCAGIYYFELIIRQEHEAFGTEIVLAVSERIAEHNIAQLANVFQLCGFDIHRNMPAFAGNFQIEKSLIADIVERGHDLFPIGTPAHGKGHQVVIVDAAVVLDMERFQTGTCQMNKFLLALNRQNLYIYPVQVSHI